MAVAYAAGSRKGDYRTDSPDDCTTPTEERAGPSPIVVDAARSR